LAGRVLPAGIAVSSRILVPRDVAKGLRFLGLSCHDMQRLRVDRRIN
jgi:hypothetical protein